MTICVTLGCNTAELECGLTSCVISCVDVVHIADIKAELSLYCSCCSLKS